MEPIDYGGVLLKRWWIPVVLGFVCALAAVLVIPSASKHSNANASPSTWKWSTAAVVGAPPPAARSLSGIGSQLTTGQIVFYAQEAVVAQAAAKAVGIANASEISAYAAGPAPKTGIAGEVTLVTNGQTPAKSAALTNAYAKALGDYINGLASSKEQGQLQQIQHTINVLKWDIAANGSKVPVEPDHSVGVGRSRSASAAGDPCKHRVRDNKARYSD